MYKPTRNHRASVCSWTLELSFLTDEQARAFMQQLIQYEVLFDFEYVTTLSEHLTHYVITVQGSWANNLIAIAQMAETVDYKEST